MPYIGKSPVGGGFHKLDALTASATATYALTLGSAAYFPETANQLLVSLNGVIQAPQDSFTVSGSNLVFDSALTASDSIDFVVALGDVLGVQTVTDGAITTAKLGNGSVTQAKLASSVTLIPTGMIAPFAMSTAPTGWLECDGSAVSRTTYADLFTALSTTHGVGDGSTTFNVPDLRGEFVRGWDNGKGTDSGRTFASSQADELKSHFHRPNNYSSDSTNRFFQGLGSGSGYSYPATGGSGSLLYSTIADQTDPTGGTETRPRNIAMMYCVKA